MAGKQAVHLEVLHSDHQSPLDMAAESFMLSREAMRCTKATLIWYRKYITALVDFLKRRGVSDIKSVTADHLRAYLVELQDRELADRTIHHHASVARAFFNYVVSEGMLNSSPMTRVKMPRLDKNILPAFDVADVQALLEACKCDRDRAIVLCLLDTGCRASEFLALNVEHVNLKTGAVQIRLGKGRKDRITFIGVKARKALIKYMMSRPDAKRDEPLWPSEHTGERLTIWGLRQMLERLGDRAHVANCHAHTFRRSFALWSLRSGMNIYALQQLMGHADLSILRRYLALVERDLEDAHRKYGAVDNML